MGRYLGMFTCCICSIDPKSWLEAAKEEEGDANLRQSSHFYRSLLHGSFVSKEFNVRDLTWMSCRLSQVTLSHSPCDGLKGSNLAEENCIKISPFWEINTLQAQLVQKHRTSVSKSSLKCTWSKGHGSKPFTTSTSGENPINDQASLCWDIHPSICWLVNFDPYEKRIRRAGTYAQWTFRTALQCVLQRVISPMCWWFTSSKRS